MTTPVSGPVTPGVPVISPTPISSQSLPGSLCQPFALLSPGSQPPMRSGPPGLTGGLVSSLQPVWARSKPQPLTSSRWPCWCRGADHTWGSKNWEHNALPCWLVSDSLRDEHRGHVSTTSYLASS